MKRRVKILALTMFTIIIAKITCLGAYGDSFEEDYSYVARIEAMFQDQGMISADTGAVLPAPVRGANAGKSPEEEEIISESNPPGGVSASHEKAYGPALEAEKTEEKEEAGLSVQKERLKETYHEEFEIYEENLADAYFIYSNVANGGITDQAVCLDLPQNVICVLEKDGQPIPYMSNQSLGETGTYVMKLTAPSDSQGEGKEPVFYQAVFRFRIQPKPEKKEEDDGMDDIARVRTFWGDSWNTEDVKNEVWNGEKGNISNSSLENSSTAENGAADTLIEDTIDDKEEETPQIDPVTGLLETYVEELGMFQETLLTGSYFYANIPNGMITNSGVSLDLGEELESSVLKDGFPYEYEKGSRFLEPGSYTVYLSEEGMDYTVSYSEKQAPEFHFRIVDGPVRDLEIFNVPKSLTLQTVSHNHNPVQIGGAFFRLEKDGVYTAVMEDERGTAWESTIVKDTAGPEVSVRTEKDTAFLSYSSEDIEKVIVTKGKEKREVPIIYELSGKGDYAVDVYDFAGNVSSVSFRLSYSMNRAAVFAIIFLLAAAFGVAIFLLRIKRKINVK